MGFDSEKGPPLFAVIMAGGSGQRFWPISRAESPKQIIGLLGEKSLLRRAFERIEPLTGLERTIIVTNQSIAQRVAQELPELPSRNILAEPLKKNTAPCICLAAKLIKMLNPDAVMVAMPADHFIGDEEGFRKIVKAAAQFAQKSGLLITLGIKPTRPETGYGYIKVGPKIGETDVGGVFGVDEFAEKPPLKRAKAYVESGKYLWNSGVFIWRAATVFEEMSKYLPDIMEKFSSIEKALGSQNEARAIYDVYSSIEGISIDYGVMEKSKNVAVIPCELSWCDVGSWGSLGEILGADELGNVCVGPNVMIDSRGCVIFSPNKLVTTIGLEDIVVVVAPDAVLVCLKEKAQEIRKIVERLNEMGLEEHI